jgi:quercetin dioxygenase-like cupin family protein
LEKKNIHTTDENQPAGEQPDFYSNKFIGNFEIRRIFNESDSKEQEMYYVIFRDRAMTKIHTHESEQVLIATSSNSNSLDSQSKMGRGFVSLIEKVGDEKKEDTTADGNDNPQFRISKTIFLDKIGDTVCIPPNVLHCHGSAQEGLDFSHIAIRRSTLDNKQQAKTLWEYDIEAMKKIMGITDDNKIANILKDIHVQITEAISDKKQ